MNILLAYYHPVIFDLAETFSKLGHKITITVSRYLSDNYGSADSVFAKKVPNPFLKDVDLVYHSVAKVKIKQKHFDLVGVDGVFDGDDVLMELCKNYKVPHFCINGYPHQIDEPSENILAFSWHLPQLQYKQKFYHEGLVKESDWKNISEKGESDGKNIFVFYPEMNAAKRFEARTRITNRVRNPSDSFISLIHRFEECNKWSYSAFSELKEFHKIENFTGLSQEETFEKIWNSKGLVHLKHADCPGISVLEALILGCPVIVMKSFVKASFNQEILIDNYNALVCNSLGEMSNRMKEVGSREFPTPNAILHIHELTHLDRQKPGLLRFLHKCRRTYV